jgi:hypothetical protein
MWYGYNVQTRVYETKDDNNGQTQTESKQTVPDMHLIEEAIYLVHV